MVRQEQKATANAGCAEDKNTECPMPLNAEVVINPLNQTNECQNPTCREELIKAMTELERTHVTHKGMMAYVGVPIGVIGIIIGLVMTIVSTNFGSLNQNLLVTKARNDYQDQRITMSELADEKMKGDLSVIREKLANMDKNICTIMERIK